MSGNSNNTTWSNTDVTTINVGYLRTLVQYFLQPLLDQVNQQLKHGQLVGGVQIPGLGSSEFTVPAGGSGFKPAADLVKALSDVGSSVNDDLTWFGAALTDTIDEINTTIAGMQNSDDLNTEQVQTFLQDYSAAISDLNSPPSGGSAGGGGSGAGSDSAGGSGSGAGGGSGSGSGSAGGSSGGSGSGGSGSGSGSGSNG